MNSTISEYIKTSRLELGLTQDELAQRAGISVRYLCDIENDHGIPSDWVYESLQQALSNHEQNRMKWGAQLRKMRRAYGVEQEWFALQLGMTTKQLRALETGKTELPYQKRIEIMSAIERFNPENEPLSIMFDYMRIRFKTTDAYYVMDKILHLQMANVITEEGGLFGYSYRHKFGKSIEDADILNRFELRLTNNAAENSADALMDSEDAAGTAFSIINNYVRFIEPQADKRRYNCPTDKHWEQFMQGEERKLKLTMKPKPFDLERTENWINTQVAKSIKMLQEIEKMKGRDFVQQLLDGTVLNEKHRKIVAQVTSAYRADTTTQHQ